MKKAKQNKQQAKAATTKNCGKMRGGKCCNESGQYQKD